MTDVNGQKVSLPAVKQAIREYVLKEFLPGETVFGDIVVINVGHEDAVFCHRQRKRLGRTADFSHVGAVLPVHFHLPAVTVNSIDIPPVVHRHIRGALQESLSLARCPDGLQIDTVRTEHLDAKFYARLELFPLQKWVMEEKYRGKRIPVVIATEQ